MPRLPLALLGLASVVAVGCATRPPPRWAEGGAALTLARAHWEPAPTTAIDLLPDGRVLVDSEVFWTIDTAGRVYDADREPVALLEQEGGLLGTDRKRLGGVGVDSAAPPDSGYAWATLAPDGRVTRYNSDGSSYNLGGWRGCEGPAQRACMLVTHLWVLREQQRSSPPGVGVGVGVGIGIGIGIRR